MERFEIEGISCEGAVRLMTVCHVTRRHSEQFNWSFWRQLPLKYWR